VDDFVGGMLVLQDVKYCFSDDTLPDGYAVNKGDMRRVRLDLSAESAAIQQYFSLTTNQRTVLSAQ
jgi:hypothetical protein